MVLVAFLVLLALTACGSDPSSIGTGNPGPQSVELFYATTLAEEKNSRDFYGRERGELTYGIADIAIPPNHLIGRNEKPSMFRFEWSENERRHIALRGVNPLPHMDFFEQLNKAVEQSPDRRLLLFVHGFNVDFPQVSRSLAQFATDLKFDGPVVLFSWPSQNSMMGYAVDAANAEWSQTHLAVVLQEILDRTDATSIHLIAHSMGGRALTRAYISTLSERPLDVYRIEQMILVAPDIDADVFRDISPSLARAPIQVTLYASSSDRALMASRAFNGHPRAGESGRGLVMVPGVETVDASETSSGLLGHGYFAEDRRIMEDIFSILTTGQGADNRFGLRPVDTPEGRYWIFRR